MTGNLASRRSLYEGKISLLGSSKASPTLIVTILVSLGVVPYLIFTDRHAQVTVAVYSFWLIMAPTVVRWARLQWLAGNSALFRQVQFIADDRSRSLGTWLAQQHERIFAVNPLALASASIVLIAGYASVLPQDSMFGSRLLDGYFALLFGVVLLEAGHFTYMVLAASVVLWTIPVRCGRAVWFALHSRELRDFERTWLALAWITSAAYCLVLVATLGTPYGLSEPFNLWLLTFSFAPLIAASVVLVGIQRVRERIKFSHLGWTSEVFEEARASQPIKWQDLESVTVLSDSMARSREWPFSPLVATTLITALASIASALFSRQGG